MTPDDITRLADIAERLDRAHSLLELSQEQKCRESMAAKVDYASSALLGAQFALTELRATLTLAQQGKAGGVAVYEVQERMSSFAPSSRWTETTRETYEGGYFPETLFHRRILYATPPTHIPDAGNMVSANPPEAGVTDEMVERARAAYYDAASVDDGVFTDPVAMRAALTAALAPQPKDAT